MLLIIYYNTCKNLYVGVAHDATIIIIGSTEGRNAVYAYNIVGTRELEAD